VLVLILTLSESFTYVSILLTKSVLNVVPHFVKNTFIIVIRVFEVLMCKQTGRQPDILEKEIRLYECECVCILNIYVFGGCWLFSGRLHNYSPSGVS